MTKDEFYALPKDERREAMAKWRNEDKASYADIAKMFGQGTTRNMIAGLCWRLLVKSNDSLSERQQLHRSKTSNLRPKKVSVVTERKIHIPRKTLPIPTDAAIWETLPGVTPVHLRETKNALLQCRWPIGHRTHTVCGLPTIEASPYCEVHSAIAFKPEVKKENSLGKS